MRGFVALLHRDWRTHRAMAAVIALSILGLSVTFRALARSADHWSGSAYLTVAAAWVLFVGGIAADVVAHEFPSRRIEALAFLPVGLLRVWSAKMAFLALLLGSFLAWTLVCQLATFAMFDRATPAVEPSQFVAGALELAIYALPLAFVIAFVALLVERTLPAMFLGFLVAGGLFAGLRSLLGIFEPALVKHTGGMFALWQGLAVAFAAAGAITFTKGGVHTQSTARRWVVAGAVMLHLVLAVALFVGWRFWTWKQLAPGDADATIHAIAVSPRGDRVAVLASK